jgi:hypothetical protein
MIITEGKQLPPTHKKNRCARVDAIKRRRAAFSIRQDWTDTEENTEREEANKEIPISTEDEDLTLMSAI